MNSPTAYMEPSTAKALLALSQKRTKALREARELRKELHRIGWSHSAAAELAAIHVQSKEQA
jgi:hypothetical protein